MLFSNRSLDYTFKVKLLTAVMVFFVVVGNDVFKRYYHGKLRISSIVCIYPFIYTQDNVCYFS